jgi:Ni,Fe-hydrogenase III component G
MRAIEDAQARLANWAKAVTEREKRLDVSIEVADLMSAVSNLKGWGYFSAIVGLDEGEMLAVLYVFCAADSVLTLKVQLGRDKPHLPSLYSILPATLLQERELAEMFGIVMDGIPDNSRFLLPDEWPTEVYPLRKDALLD